MHHALTLRYFFFVGSIVRKLCYSSFAKFFQHFSYRKYEKKFLIYKLLDIISSDIIKRLCSLNALRKYLTPHTEFHFKNSCGTEFTQLADTQPKLSRKENFTHLFFFRKHLKKGLIKTAQNVMYI